MVADAAREATTTNEWANGGVRLDTSASPSTSSLSNERMLLYYVREGQEK